ncbi:2-dehydropantoate 2-reductase N-terminal domain-containing protein [Haloarculaceae archaeon H-GB2-1]|nr:2-dehydropantoate 2-reductase N-terminal domain-containing protein [Haloarculaceae archaeon H-GB2-1]
MKVAVIGPGSLGTLYGGLLADAGHEVWLCHYRDAYVEAVERDGVRIESDILDRSVVEADVRATTDASEAGHVDLAFVLVKAHQTRDALARHEGCIGPDTTVLSLQNGLLNERILSDIVGPERVLTGITYQGGDRGDPGRVEHTYTGETRFGGEDMDAAREIAGSCPRRESQTSRRSRITAVASGRNRSAACRSNPSRR